MGEIRIVSTSAGPVEIVLVPGKRPPVLFFPGGHCSATCDCGWALYAESGHAILSFSRPGYGDTEVGQLSAAEFAPLVGEVCEQLDISGIAAAVGVSFGGMQAVHVAAVPELAVSRLVLHSCAPSGLPYPDTRAEAIGGPVLFSPLLQGLVWRLVRGLVRSDSGLRLVMARLSTLPVEDWWDQLSDADRDKARALFQSMRSGRGFVNDLRQGRPGGASARRAAMENVRCPTLVTGSPHDRGVSFVHAQDFANVIPGATLVELDSPSHIFWIGPGRTQLTSIIGSFLDE
jgi:pimeloyl-ACP methyl ester carboxylesterase